MTGRVRVGTAGWSLPVAVQPAFSGEGSHLERYAGRFAAAEINTSFYRSHRADTWARWAASVPADFAFAVKVPKTITHEQRLVSPGAALDAFLAEVRSLGAKLGPLLVQLPPKLDFDAAVAKPFFIELRARHTGPVAVEPRHPSWFDAAADALLAEHRVARVAADPAPVPAAAIPGGDATLVYYRLHGSPRTYYSSYDDDYLDALALRLRDVSARSNETWCIFDNTASGAAAANALALAERLAR
ncbi:MAG TPA: DUF72 domain-containing protein [Gemmatimonadaceae bacterium]|nr:DUF72 domain-containing protein [Gemmatimonadaceae bacterium]